MSDKNFQRASEMFSDFYQYCLDSGVEPEDVVRDYGDMVLVTKPELVERVLELLGQ